MDPVLIERVTDRIAVLRQEHRAGEEQVRALENRQRDLRSTLLRISGAIQVLEEMLDEARQTAASDSAASGVASVSDA